MALQGSGAISLSDLATEFGDTTPNSVSEFYAGGSLVGAHNASVPASGAISLTDFYSATVAVDIALTDHSVSTASQSSYTFSSQSLGAEDDGRYIIVAFGSQEATATAVTVAGVSATQLVNAPDAGGADENASLWIAAVPTGTTGDIVVTLDSNSTCCGIGVWRKTGGGANASSIYAVDDESGTPSEDLNIPAGGGAICYGFQRTNTTTTRGTVTGLTEDFDEEVDAANSVHIGGSGTFAAAQSALTTTISFGTSGVRAAHYVAATFGP